MARGTYDRGKFALVVLGGIITTLAGMGGGLFLVAVLGALYGPHFALATTTPALLASNLRRAYLFRAEVDRPVARAFALGALPAALVAGDWVPAVPALVLQLVLVGATLVTLAAFVGTIATAAVALHAGRLLGYGFGGLVGEQHLAPMAALAAGLVAGNFLGRLLRSRLQGRVERVVEVGTLLVCTVVAVVGAAR